MEYQEIVNGDVSINRFDGEIQKLDVLSDVRFGEYTNPKVELSHQMREDLFVTTRFQGGTYRGYWQNGRIEGRGRWNHEGNTYEGTWRDGGLTGCNTLSVFLFIVTFFFFVTLNMTSSDISLTTDGSLVYLSGDKYEGGFFKGQPHGSGTIFCASGDLYFGNWIEGRREGFGEYTMVDGSIYTGGWSHNSPFGEGTLLIPKQG